VSFQALPVGGSACNLTLRGVLATAKPAKPATDTPTNVVRAAGGIDDRWNASQRQTGSDTDHFF
jgi:hypothetical protein